jgi:hypothetical protein
VSELPETRPFGWFLEPGVVEAQSYSQAKHQGEIRLRPKHINYYIWLPAAPER